MGLTHSKADTTPPPMPKFVGASDNSTAEDVEAVTQDKAGGIDLPAPVKYEDLSREILTALKPELFEGLRFDITRPLNQNFFLTHSMFLGNMDIPTANKQAIKCPIGTYEFGANVVQEKYYLLGRITSDARLSGRAKLDLNDALSVKLHAQLGNEPGQSQVMLDTDLKGKDWNGQLKLGNPNFYGINYLQSVTPNLSVGGEFFWLQSNLKSGVGLAARHSDDKNIATLQLATTGILTLQYAHKVTDKITLATDLWWHLASREATATVGYDCMLRQCRLRGKIDTTGVVSCYLEERFTPGINFLLSGELDHARKNYNYTAAVFCASDDCAAAFVKGIQDKSFSNLDCRSNISCRVEYLDVAKTNHMKGRPNRDEYLAFTDSSIYIYGEAKAVPGGVG